MQMQNVGSLHLDLYKALLHSSAEPIYVLVSIYSCADTGFIAWLMGWREQLD